MEVVEDDFESRSMSPNPRRGKMLPPKPTLPPKHPLTEAEKAELLSVGRYGMRKGGLAWGDLVRKINSARCVGRDDDRWPLDWPDEVVRGDLFMRFGQMLEESEPHGLQVQEPPPFPCSGMVCTFVGLERLSDLNGQSCTVVKSKPSSGRLQVTISSTKKSVLVRPENLEPR